MINGLPLLSLRCHICQVEEIDDIDGSSGDPFIVAAIANEKELLLSEEQKRNYRKVCCYSYPLYFFSVKFSYLNLGCEIAYRENVLFSFLMFLVPFFFICLCVDNL